MIDLGCFWLQSGGLVVFLDFRPLLLCLCLPPWGVDVEFVGELLGRVFVKTWFLVLNLISLVTGGDAIPTGAGWIGCWRNEALPRELGEAIVWRWSVPVTILFFACKCCRYAFTAGDGLRCCCCWWWGIDVASKERFIVLVVGGARTMCILLDASIVPLWTAGSTCTVWCKLVPQMKMSCIFGFRTPMQRRCVWYEMHQQALETGRSRQSRLWPFRLLDSVRYRRGLKK